ncbi:MAG: ribonuclease Z [Acidimicrobiia bacterium]|nr:ribonuclease Z [Acidimicrobiia bacterium]MCL4293828.1 ribonuclease Z [Acidimicrobiia bacterium]
MSGVELVVLGTASQAPTRTRNHNGYLLRWDREAILFDPGEGTQRQFLHAGVAAVRTTRVCITHLHGDHCLGLPGILQQRALDRAEAPVPVHFPASGLPYVERLRDASIGRRVEVSLDPVPEAGGVVAEAPLRISALPLAHRVPTLGWRVEEPARVHLVPERLEAAGIAGPDAGRLLDAGTLTVDGRTVELTEVSEVRSGRSVAVVMDTGVCDEAVRLAEGVDVLLCEATYLESEVSLAVEYGHLTARQAATIAREAGAGLLVLTHFSDRYPDLAGHRREAGEVFPDVVVAEDLQVVEVRASRPPGAPGATGPPGSRVAP